MPTRLQYSFLLSRFSARVFHALTLTANKMGVGLPVKSAVGRLGSTAHYTDIYSLAAC